MKKYSIDVMTSSHIPELARIERECFHTPWSENALREELGKGLFLVATDEQGTVVGYVGCQIVLDEGYITNVAVCRSARRQGVARQLLHALEQHARLAELCFITLEVRQSNTAAMRLYQQAGYRTVGIRKNFYRQPTEDAVLMTQYLQESKQ